MLRFICFLLGVAMIIDKGFGSVKREYMNWKVYVNIYRY